VIGKVCQRGSDVRRLLGYLFREGLAGEHGLSAPHADAHLIAAWDGPDGPEGLEPPRQDGGGRDLGTLAAALNAPLLAAGLDRQEWQQARPVYHLAISTAEHDRPLSDQEWADVVGEYVHRIGLAPHGSEHRDEQAVRWVAVRHAANHVHVVATLARQDGRRVWPRNDFYRAREASLAVEHRYGLTPTSPADRAGDRQTSRAEQRRHARRVEQRAERGRPAPAGPDREVLRGKVRAALAGASSFEEFSERLRRDGVLVRPRMSTLNPQEITGYAVALRATGRDAAEGIEPVWFGGGKLAPDLTFPQLQARWCREPADPRHAATAGHPVRGGLELGPAERQALWETAGHAVGRADEQLRAAASGDPTARAMAEAAAVAASEVLSAVGRLTERSGAAAPLRGRRLRQGRPRTTPRPPRPDRPGPPYPPGGRRAARDGVRPQRRHPPAPATPRAAQPAEPDPCRASRAARPDPPGRRRPARRRAAHRRTDPAHSHRVRQHPRADSNAAGGAGDGPPPDPRVVPPTVQLARSAGRTDTGEPSGQGTVIDPSGGRTLAGAGQDPCPWRAKTSGQGCLPLPVGSRSHFSVARGRRTGADRSPEGP
jgi:hypothetical protein